MLQEQWYGRVNTVGRPGFEEREPGAFRHAATPASRGLTSRERAPIMEG